MRSVVVTGVSAGIGWGVVKTLTANGIHVFGSVRKQADADRLRKAFSSTFTPLVFDVTDETAVRMAAAAVRESLNGKTLFGLVNNAGIALPGPVLYQPMKDFRVQIDVNLIGAFTVCSARIARLTANPEGSSTSHGSAAASARRSSPDIARQSRVLKVSPKVCAAS